MPDLARARTLFVEFAKEIHGITDHDIAEAIQYEG
jgi:hypothetical protein